MKVFLGSSSESIKDMEFVSTILEDIRDVECIPLKWSDEDIWPLGGNIWQNLVKISKEVDAAIFLVSGDDRTWYRQGFVELPRDNVLLEFGLFTGSLDREKVILLKAGSPKIASDLEGLVYYAYSETKKNSLKRKLERWVLEIESTNLERGKTDSHHPPPFAEIQDTHEIRKQMIANSESEIICIGPSLNTAFNRLFHNSSGNISASIIDVLISKPVDIRIFITNPEFIENGHTSPLHMGVVRIKETINTLSEMAKHLSTIAKSTPVKGSFHIYYVNYSDLDHVIMVDDSLIFRPTLLWDYHSYCKGNVSKLSKGMRGFDGCQSYIALLKENAKQVNNSFINLNDDAPVYSYVVDVETARTKLWELEG